MDRFPEEPIGAGADYVVELGPEAGEDGGKIVAAGAPQILVEKRTTTGRVIEDLLRPRKYAKGK